MVLDTSRMDVTIEQPKFGNPASLGLSSMALTTFVFSAWNTGWAPNLMWVGLALFFGGIGQFAAGMWEFRRNATFTATVFSTYAGFWLSLGITLVFALCGLLPTGFDLNQALAYFILGFFIVNTMFLITSLLAPAAIFLVFVLLEATLLCLCIGRFKDQAPGDSGTFTMAGGAFGHITAAAAWYVSFAVLFNETSQKPVIPLGSPLLSFPADTSSPAGKEDV